MLDRFSLISSAATSLLPLAVLAAIVVAIVGIVFSALRLSSPIYRIFTLILR